MIIHSEFPYHYAIEGCSPFKINNFVYCNFENILNKVLELGNTGKKLHIKRKKEKNHIPNLCLESPSISKVIRSVIITYWGGGVEYSYEVETYCCKFVLSICFPSLNFLMFLKNIVTYREIVQ